MPVTFSRRDATDLVKRLGRQADERGIDSLNEDQRNILVPYWAYGIIGNGGFRYLLEGSHDLVDVARRFRALGFPDVGRACEEVASKVFGEQTEPDPSDRADILSRFEWDAFDAQDAVVFRVSAEALVDAIAAYVSSHPNATRT